jgi:NAD-dependent SIR2 family protein deacetylase
MKTTVILGAGFSKNSGVPLQSEIPELLIKYGRDEEFEDAISLLLRRFMKDIFGYNGLRGYPNLDDIFTCIDISTNSGHHLGIGYSSTQLRSIRRFLVYRVFSVLKSSFRDVKDVSKLIETLNMQKYETDYVVLNWDTVLETYLLKQKSNLTVNYCNGGQRWGTDNHELETDSIKVIKPHGSLNWLYCDNCRILINDNDESITLKQRAGFLENDLKLLNDITKSNFVRELQNKLPCSDCGNEISSHIATFSYRKTFRANSFSSIWNETEKQLSESDRWVFIGYSLPDADYEFKHLLKIAELKLEHKRKEKLKIDVVLLNSDKTINKYENFFGSRLSYVCNKGINEYAEYLKSI